MWEELSDLTTPEELNQYQYEHSYLGQKIAEYANNASHSHFTRKQLLAIYREYDVRYDHMDGHVSAFAKMEFEFTGNVEDGIFGGAHQPGSFGYGKYLEQMNQPWITQAKLDDTEEIRNFMHWRTQYLKSAQNAHMKALQ